MQPIPLQGEAALLPSGPACLLSFKHPRTFPSALLTLGHQYTPSLCLYSTGNFNLTRGGGREVGQVESLMRAPAFLQVQTESISNPFPLCLTSEVMVKKSARPLGNCMKQSSAWSDTWWTRWLLGGASMPQLPLTVPTQEGSISCCRAVSRPLWGYQRSTHDRSSHQMYTCISHLWEIDASLYSLNEIPVHSLKPPDTSSFEQGLQGGLSTDGRSLLCPACTERSWAGLGEACIPSL